MPRHTVVVRSQLRCTVDRRAEGYNEVMPPGILQPWLNRRLRVAASVHLRDPLASPFSKA